jgi:hypothetical protein
MRMGYPLKDFKKLNNQEFSTLRETCEEARQLLENDNHGDIALEKAAQT